MRMRTSLTSRNIIPLFYDHFRFDLGDQEKTKGEVTKSDDLKVRIMRLYLYYVALVVYRVFGL